MIIAIECFDSEGNCCSLRSMEGNKFLIEESLIPSQFVLNPNLKRVWWEIRDSVDRLMLCF